MIFADVTNRITTNILDGFLKFYALINEGAKISLREKFKLVSETLALQSEVRKKFSLSPLLPLFLHRVSSRRSQVFAIAHSCAAVAREMCKASAVSSKVKPLK